MQANYTIISISPTYLNVFPLTYNLKLPCGTNDVHQYIRNNYAFRLLLIDNMFSINI